MSSPRECIFILLEGSMEFLHEIVNASPEGLNVSSVGLCIIAFKKLRFLKLIIVLPEGLSVS